MATQANISNFKFRIASIASPASYNDLEEVLSVSGVGKTNELIEVTNFDSPAGTKEFIAGLADGSEVTVEANYYQAATEQANLIALVDAGSTVNCQVAYTAVSPDETWSFAGVCIGWELTPSATEQNRITFTVKISGDIT